MLRVIHCQCKQNTSKADGVFLVFGIWAVASVSPDLKLGFSGVPSPLNPLGVKGCGEAGAIASPAALINAIIDALSPLGVTNIDMPANPQKIWQAIQDAAA